MSTTSLSPATRIRFQSGRWPYIAAALVGGHVVLMMIATFIAVKIAKPSIDPSYYDHANDYSQQHADPADGKQASP